MVFRIVFSILLFLSVLFAPFWVSIILTLFGMFYFNLFLEGVVFFLLSDLLYGVKENKFSGEVFISFLIAMVALLVIEILKKRLKFYDNKIN